MNWWMILIAVGIGGLIYLWKDKGVEEIEEKTVISPVKKLKPEEKRKKILDDFCAEWEECWETMGAYTFDTKRWNEKYSKAYETCEDRQVIVVIDKQFRDYGTIQVRYLKGLLADGLEKVSPAYEPMIDNVLENLTYMFSYRNGEMCLVNCPVNIKAFRDGVYNLFHKKIPVTEGETERLLKLVEGY